MNTVAIIAGSGAGELLPFRDWESTRVETRFGSVDVRTGDIDGRKVLFAQRHGHGHVTLPHLINYKAIITALQQLGADRIIGTAAVGSLTREIMPGTAAVLTDFIDFTRRQVVTIFDGTVPGVIHTDFTEPYCREISRAILSACGTVGLEVTAPCTYLCVDGPRYETPAEISMFRHWGADVIGMTNAPEAIIAREIGVCYGAIAIITNFACGISQTYLSHEEVVSMMKSVEEKLALVLTESVKALPETCECRCRINSCP